MTIADTITRHASKDSFHTVFRLWRNKKNQETSSNSTLVPSVSLPDVEDASYLDKLLDFPQIGPLDFELSKKVFCYLSPRDLCRCSQVSQLWRKLSMQPIFWQLFCVYEAIPIESSDYALLNLCNNDQGLWWKCIYVYRKFALYNWRHLRFRARALRLNSDERITCFGLIKEDIIFANQMSELKRIHFQDPFSLCSETRVFHATEALSLGIIYSILVHPQLPIVISGDQKGSVSLWHLETETLIAHEEGVHSGTVSALQITDLNRFISTAFDKCINMINIERRHDIRGFLKSISEDCRRLLPETMQKLHQSRLTRMASYFKREAIPQPTTKHSALERNKYAVKMARKKSIRGFQSDICCMEFIEGENTLITAHMDGTLQVWDSSMLCVVKTMYAHKDSILALCLHDGYLYSGSTDKTIKRWNINKWKCESTLTAHKNWIKVIKANQFWLISGGWDESLFVWDVKSLVLAKKIEIGLGPIFDFHMNDSKIMVLSKGKGNDNQLTILDFGMDFSYLKSPIYQS